MPRFVSLPNVIDGLAAVPLARRKTPVMVSVPSIATLASIASATSVKFWFIAVDEIVVDGRKVFGMVIAVIVAPCYARAAAVMPGGISFPRLAQAAPL